jgi:BlaI family transcriptional regulator, penicillinase repressor
MDSFTPCELEIMGVLWRCAPLKPAEILDQLDRRLTNAALRSTLRVLVEKGHITRRKKGKAYYYRPRKSAPVAFKKMIGRLADLFCEGSSYGLVARLIESEDLSENDLHLLQELAKEQASDRKSSGKES